MFLDSLGTPAVIDEVQRGGDPLILAVKQRLDGSRRPGQFVLTGSTNFTTDSWSLQENNLITLHSHELAAFYGTDFEQLWSRGKITESIPMASTVSTVSRNDSPFFTDEVPTLKFMVSAESRLAAVSKERRVRVESS